ncbi:MAG TPA: Hsp70 family protein [Polyangiaceae bacterium]|nr:Hsp70 family protein [Polyangiaceae bacterium]
MTPRFVVGIDLGTSHSVVASAPRSGGAPSIEPVVQRATPTTLEALPLFPSCAYAAFAGDMPALADLDEADGWVLGEAARRRGAEVPGRLVASSKSWLCHPRADKEAPILPWGADPDVPKLSPVDVATRILHRIRTSWDRAHPDAPLEAQDVVLTVPASFDEVARELTVRAAHAAGLRVRLLEEPQAAFYAAMQRGALASLPRLTTTGWALVCDVGGGTTDLSLFELTPSADGPPKVERVAVGPHLLLGGDNMDLALAHAIEPELGGDKLEATRFGELVIACRAAKEKLLGGDPPESVRVTLLGRGSDLLGGAKRAMLGRETAMRLVVDGFFPMLTAGEAPPPRARSGLVSLGLPYERDPAITRHVAAFLERHLPRGAHLDAVLLNGGVFKAKAIAERIVLAIAAWQGRPLVLLDHEDADLAVALGAATFGLALLGRGPRIESGAAKSYFVGLGKDAQGKRAAVCVVPKGSPEGVRHALKRTPLVLVVGRPARFDLFASDDAVAVSAGDVVEIDDERFDALPALSTTVGDASGAGSATKPGSGSELRVVLEAELTPVGTLELACVPRDAGGGAPERYRLAFDLRQGDVEHGAGARPPSDKRAGAALDRALDEITRVYGRGTTSEARDAKNLLRELEKLLGDRQAWSADTARALADRLLDHLKGRRRTLDHERVWFQLTGFCMRPGFGAPGDDARGQKLAPLFAERLAFPKETRSWQQLFICFRRAAGGLPEAAQIALRDELDAYVAPAEARKKKPKTPLPEGTESDLLDLLSYLERVPANRRVELASWILERTWTRRDPRLWAAIGRLGARVPAYASAHHVVSARVAEKHLEELLRDKWADLPTAPRAAAELARMTGDRARDLSDSIRRELLARFDRESVDPSLVAMVREVVAVKEAERATFFGERLPSGLRLDADG